MKNTRKKLSLKPETIRRLIGQELGHAAGGYTSAIDCEPTQFTGCVPKMTPKCPI